MGKLAKVVFLIALFIALKVQGAPNTLPRNFTKMGYQFVNKCGEGEIPLRGMCRQVFNFYDHY